MALPVECVAGDDFDRANTPNTPGTPTVGNGWSAGIGFGDLTSAYIQSNNAVFDLIGASPDLPFAPLTRPQTGLVGVWEFSAAPGPGTGPGPAVAAVMRLMFVTSLGQFETTVSFANDGQRVVGAITPDDGDGVTLPAVPYDPDLYESVRIVVTDLGSCHLDFRWFFLSEGEWLEFHDYQSEGPVTVSDLFLIGGTTAPEVTWLGAKVEYVCWPLDTQDPCNPCSPGAPFVDSFLVDGPLAAPWSVQTETDAMVSALDGEMRSIPTTELTAGLTVVSVPACCLSGRVEVHDIWMPAENLDGYNSLLIESEDWQILVRVDNSTVTITTPTFGPTAFAIPTPDSLAAAVDIDVDGSFADGSTEFLVNGAVVATVSDIETNPATVTFTANTTGVSCVPIPGESFADNFERADGPLNNGWVDGSFGAAGSAIVGGEAVLTAASAADIASVNQPTLLAQFGDVTATGLWVTGVGTTAALNVLIPGGAAIGVVNDTITYGDYVVVSTPGAALVPITPPAPPTSPGDAVTVRVNIQDLGAGNVGTTIYLNGVQQGAQIVEAVVPLSTPLGLFAGGLDAPSVTDIEGHVESVSWATPSTSCPEPNLDGVHVGYVSLPCTGDGPLPPCVPIHCTPARRSCCGIPRCRPVVS